MGRRGAEKNPRRGFGERKRTTPSGGPVRDEERSDEQSRRAHQFKKNPRKGIFLLGRRGAEKNPRRGFGERKRTTPSGGPVRDEERSDEQSRRAHQFKKNPRKGIFLLGRRGAEKNPRRGFGERKRTTPSGGPVRDEERSDEQSRRAHQFKKNPRKGIFLLGRRGAEKNPRRGFGERKRTTPSGGPVRDEERSDEQSRRAHQFKKNPRKGIFFIGAHRLSILLQTFFNRLDCRGQLPERRDFGIGARAAVFLFALI